MNNRLVMVALLVLVFFVSSRAVIRQELFPMHDYVHGARIAEMYQAVADGHIPPRWSAHFGYGYGMPLFLFYAPLPYYVGAFFYSLGASLVTSVQLLFIVVNVLTMIGTYLMGKLLGGKWMGLLLATLYTLAPYRAVNLFVRGALSEAWGMAMLPWMIVGWLMILQNKHVGWLVLVLSTAALLLSHNLTAFIFVPFFILIILAQWLVQSRNWLQLLRTFGSLALGFGLATYYVIPALLESKYTQLRSLILTGYFDFRLHFLYLRQFFLDVWNYGGSQWGPDDGISFFLGYGLLLATAIGAGAFFWQLKSNRWRMSTALWANIGLAALTGVALLLTTQKTQWLWEAVPFMSYLQFPWRYLLLITMLLMLLVATSWSVVRPSNRAVLACIVVGITLVTSWRYFQPAEYLSDSSALYYADAGRIASHMSGILPDYIPQKFTLTDKPSTGIVYAQSSELDSQVLVDRTHQVLLAVQPNRDTQLTFGISDFPGWQVELDGRVVEHEVSSEGLISIVVPQGTQLVSTRLTDTPVRRVADIVSVLSLLVVLSLVMYQTTQHRSQ